MYWNIVQWNFILFSDDTIGNTYYSYKSVLSHCTWFDHRTKIMLTSWIIYWNKVKLCLLLSISVTQTH